METNLASRLNALASEVEPLGGRVVDADTFDPEGPEFAGHLSVDGDHSPLHDIPAGYLVVGRADSEVMRRHRILMGLEPVEATASACQRVWEIAARVAQRAEQGGGGGPFLAASLPKRSPTVPPLSRAGVERLSGQLHPRLIKGAAMDLVGSLLEQRTDLELGQFRGELVLYVARAWPPQEPDPVRPWEKAIPAPGGNILGWAVPDAVVQRLIDDALDVEHERSAYRGLARRM